VASATSTTLREQKTKSVEVGLPTLAMVTSTPPLRSTVKGGIRSLLTKKHARLSSRSLSFTDHSAVHAHLGLRRRLQAKLPIYGFCRLNFTMTGLVLAAGSLKCAFKKPF